jgi:hypothetical protein
LVAAVEDIIRVLQTPELLEDLEEVVVPMVLVQQEQQRLDKDMLEVQELQVILQVGAEVQERWVRQVKQQLEEMVEQVCRIQFLVQQ